MSDPQVHRSVSRPDHVLVQHLPDDESVFLDLESERYFGLDGTGTAMWKALMETNSVDEAVDRLLREFEVDPETLRHDLTHLIGELSQRGLLRVDERQGATPSADGG